MFTGLIETTARIERLDERGHGRVLRLATPLSAELGLGDSIAVSGVCLTVVSKSDRAFDVEVSPETLRVTTMGHAVAGQIVNLERPLRADARLGGHFVLGHVDACGRLAAVRSEGDYHWIEVVYPTALAPLIIPKGSIAVDGISLTVASLSAEQFGVQIVPFTWTHTTLGTLEVGSPVNLEADVIGKYVARLHDASRASLGSDASRVSLGGKKR